MIMRIVRHNKDYTIIDNATLRDESLSFRATGMLAYLLSMPEDWEPNGRQLTLAKTEGRDAVFATLSELERAGYLVRSYERAPDGTFIHVSTVYERLSDRPAADTTVADTHVLENRTPDPGNQEPVKPDSDNQDSYKDDQKKDYRKNRSFGSGEQSDSPLGAENSSARNGAAKSSAKLTPDTFVVTPEMVAWAADNTSGGVDVGAQTEQFLDWWRATGRVYKDPVAGWRNWLRRSKPGAMAPWRQPDKTNRNKANIYGDESRSGGMVRIQ